MSKNRYKFSFGQKVLTLTMDHDNLFMEEVERLAHEKYDALKERLPQADDETLAILLAVNSLALQLSREQDLEKERQELAALMAKTQSKSLLKDKGDKTK